MISQASPINDPGEQLREAKRRMAELREDWRSANARRPAAAARESRRRPPRARVAVGQAFISLGRALTGPDDWAGSVVSLEGNCNAPAQARSR